MTEKSECFPCSLKHFRFPDLDFTCRVRFQHFNKGDDPGRIIDERKIELNLTKNKTIICPYAEIDSKNFNCVFLKKQCPIKCSLDPPEFELFFKMCKLDKNNKKSLLNFISTIKY